MAVGAGTKAAGASLAVHLNMEDERDESIIDVTGTSQKIDYSNTPVTPASPEPTRNDSSYESRYYQDEASLSTKYKTKLGLNKQDVAWLNKVGYQYNVFLAIEGCGIETIKLYLDTVKEVQKQLRGKNTTMAKEIATLEQYAVDHGMQNSKNYWSGYDFSYYKERVESEAFITLFKRAENAVREKFGHKRKISDTFSFSIPELAQEYEQRIGELASRAIDKLIVSVLNPDEGTEIELNAQNVSRWKTEFDQLTSAFNNPNKEAFIAGVHHLAKVNTRNPSVENIYFEASKFIAKHDKEQALKLYLHYLYCDLKSDKFDNKQLTKTIQKSLFSTGEQLNEFQQLVDVFVKDRDLGKALSLMPKIYGPKRKQIRIDRSVVDAVKNEHSETVELLNEYLVDEKEDAFDNQTPETSEEVKITIARPVASPVSRFIEPILLNEVQTAAIDLFLKSGNTLPVNEVESFARSSGAFRNQLIDSINEGCYEALDDVLIEEDGECYVLNEDYYSKLLVK